MSENLNEAISRVSDALDTAYDALDSRLSAAELSSARKVEALADEILEIPAGEEWDYEWDNHTVYICCDLSVGLIKSTQHPDENWALDMQDNVQYGNYSLYKLPNDAGNGDRITIKIKCN